MNIRILFKSAALLCGYMVTAQDSTQQARKASGPLSFSGFADAYYSYDFNKPADGRRPGFFYNHNRHNEFTVNLAFLKAAYATERVRANLSIAAGTYMNANYAAEPATLKNIFEANAGYKLAANKNLWLDVGIMPSHIGFESAISKDQWTLTRSLMAENSPYYESGARLGYATAKGRLQLAVLALNGWQRIARADGNSMMSWGMQATFKSQHRLTLNYSFFFGTDKPDSARLLRYYHDIYGIFQINQKIALTAGFDIGMEDKPLSGGVYTWYAPIGILRFTPNARWAVALRGEYFSDRHGVIISTGTPDGFRTAGCSINFDYRPQPEIALRIEGRYLKSKDEIFLKEGAARDRNSAITFSTAISF